MTTIKERLAIVAALMAVAGQGWAQQPQSAPPESAAVAGAAAVPAPAGRFESLSADDQKIARALFLAQQVTADGPPPLSMDQVAALKSGDSWGKVLAEMRARGLVQAKSLGELADAHERPRAKAARVNAKPLTATRATGRSGAIGAVSARRNDG